MSCLFNSLARFVDDSPDLIRQKCVNYLALNKYLSHVILASDYIRWEYNSDLQSYVKKMRKSTTWGSSIEIKSFCNLYNIKVIIKNIRDVNDRKIEFIPISDQYTKICEISWIGNHFHVETI
jgi:hypothetical protein